MSMSCLQRHRPVLAEEPNMKLDHAMLLMEDFDIVPQLLPRRDIRMAFKLAADTGEFRNACKVSARTSAQMNLMARYMSACNKAGERAGRVLQDLMQL